MKRILAVGAGVLVVMTSACGSVVPSSNQGGQDQQPSASGKPAAPSTPIEPMPTVNPIGSRELKTDTGTLQADVYPIKREPKATIVTVRVESKSGKVSGSTLQSSGLSIGPDAMSLVDTTGGMIYLPSTINREPVCGPRMPTAIDEGEAIYTNCVFGPLPAEVKSVSLRFGNLGSFDGVPVR